MVRARTIGGATDEARATASSTWAIVGVILLLLRGSAWHGAHVVDLQRARWEDFAEDYWILKFLMAKS